MTDVMIDFDTMKLAMLIQSTDNCSRIVEAAGLRLRLDTTDVKADVSSITAVLSSECVQQAGNGGLQCDL